MRAGRRVGPVRRGGGRPGPPGRRPRPAPGDHGHRPSPPDLRAGRPGHRHPVHHRRRGGRTGLSAHRAHRRDLRLPRRVLVRSHHGRPRSGGRGDDPARTVGDPDPSLRHRRGGHPERGGDRPAGGAERRAAAGGGARPSPWPSWPPAPSRWRCGSGTNCARGPPGRSPPDPQPVGAHRRHLRLPDVRGHVPVHSHRPRVRAGPGRRRLRLRGLGRRVEPGLPAAVGGHLRGQPVPRALRAALRDPLHDPPRGA